MKLTTTIKNFKNNIIGYFSNNGNNGNDIDLTEFYVSNVANGHSMDIQLGYINSQEHIKSIYFVNDKLASQYKQTFNIYLPQNDDNRKLIIYFRLYPFSNSYRQVILNIRTDAGKIIVNKNFDTSTTQIPVLMKVTYDGTSLIEENLGEVPTA